MGREVERDLVGILKAHSPRHFPVAWGKVNRQCWILPDGRVLVRIPHLSRFPLFSRAESRQALMEVFKDKCFLGWTTRQTVRSASSFTEVRGIKFCLLRRRWSS